MSRPLFNVTLERVTYKSAEYGEAAECYLLAERVGLRDAFKAVSPLTSRCEAESTWAGAACAYVCYSEFESGDCVTHIVDWPRNVTPACAWRLARLFNHRF